MAFIQSFPLVRPETLLISVSSRRHRSRLTKPRQWNAAQRSTRCSLEAGAQKRFMNKEQESRVSSLDGDSRFAEIDGVQVHHKLFQARTSSLGKDVPCTAVCVHGFGASLFSFELCRELSDFFNVVAYDTPGFGFTSRPSKLKYYTPRFSARIANSLATAYTPNESFVIIGHSMGAIAAVCAAYAQPKRVRALILIAPALIAFKRRHGWFGKATQAVCRAFAILCFLLSALLAPVVILFMRVLVSREFFWRSGLKFSRSACSEVPETVVDGYRRPTAAPGWEGGVINFVRAGLKNATDSTEQRHDYVGMLEMLGRSGVPILIVHGRDDKMVPLPNSRRIAQAVPHARLVVMDSCGHVPHEEKPVLFSELIAKFCNVV